MPRVVRLSSLVVAILVLAGCGGSTESTTELGPTGDEAQSLSINGAAARAATLLDGRSARFTVSGDVSFDTSEVAGGALTIAGSLSSPIHFSGKGEQTSASRVSLSLNGSANSAVRVVIYDGTTYAAFDGLHYRALDSASVVDGGIGLTPADVKQFGGDAGTAELVGMENVGGVSAAHIRVSLDEQTFGRRFTAAYAHAFAVGAEAAAAAKHNPLPAGFEQLIDDATFFKDGQADIWVSPHDGLLRRVDVQVEVSLTFDRIATAAGLRCACQLGLPSGSLVTRAHQRIDVSDYGAAVSVAPPVTDPNAPGGSAQGGFEV